MGIMVYGIFLIMGSAGFASSTVSMWRVEMGPGRVSIATEPATGVKPTSRRSGSI